MNAVYNIIDLEFPDRELSLHVSPDVDASNPVDGVNHRPVFIVPGELKGGDSLDLAWSMLHRTRSWSDLRFDADGSVDELEAAAHKCGAYILYINRRDAKCWYLSEEAPIGAYWGFVLWTPEEYDRHGGPENSSYWYMYQYFDRFITWSTGQVLRALVLDFEDRPVFELSGVYNIYQELEDHGYVVGGEL